jgi:hypothetical protein
MDGNGYPTPANPMGTRIKWRRVWLRKRPVEVLSGKIPDPSGLAEAGLEVPNPYPLSHVPGCPHMSLSKHTNGTLKNVSSDPDRHIPSSQRRPITPPAWSNTNRPDRRSQARSSLPPLACSSFLPDFYYATTGLLRSHGCRRSQLSPSRRLLFLPWPEKLV